jgi:hypothetical protein
MLIIKQCVDDLDGACDSCMSYTCVLGLWSWREAAGRPMLVLAHLLYESPEQAELYTQ